MTKKNSYLSDSSEWTFELLEKYDKEIARIAHEKFKLDNKQISSGIQSSRR